MTPSETLENARKYLASLRAKGDTTTTLDSLLAHVPGARELVTDNLPDPVAEAERAYRERISPTRTPPKQDVYGRDLDEDGFPLPGGPIDAQRRRVARGGK